MTEPSPTRAPAGYVSEEARRTYTVLVGVLAILALAAQFILPWLAVMPTMMKTTFEQMHLRALDAGAIWGDALWFPDRSLQPQGDHEARTSLARVRLEPGSQPERVVPRIPDDAVLLAGNDALWVLSIEGVSKYMGRELTPVPTEGKPGAFGSPFLLDGRPAAVIARPAGYSIVVLEGSSWKVRWSVPSSFGSAESSDLRAVYVAGTVHLFIAGKNQIFHKAATNEPVVELDDSWQVVTVADGTWGALDLGGVVGVFTLPRPSAMGRLRVFARSEPDWSPILDEPAPAFADKTALLPGTRGNTFYIASSSPFGNGRVVVKRDGRTVSDIRFGEAPFPKMFRRLFGIVFGSIVLIGVGFAGVLSLLMPRFRKTAHVSEQLSVAYAPVWRRALAEVIDATVLFGPLIISYFGMFSRFGEIDDAFTPGAMLAGIGAVFASMTWVPIGGVLHAFLEGKWGFTLGKLALGIRTVGTDLRPCGFGRALLRNILTVVDGFFYFTVGLIVVAVTEHWQRVGDLVARTVVVRADALRETRGLA